MSTPDQPTPWTDSHGFGITSNDDQSRVVWSDKVRDLERHLRQIISAHAEYERDGEAAALADAINKAKDFLK